VLATPDTLLLVAMVFSLLRREVPRKNRDAPAEAEASREAAVTAAAQDSFGLMFDGTNEAFVGSG
jgi:hypothetical protein